MPFHNHFPIILLSILCSAVIGQQACHQPQPTKTVSALSLQEAEEIIVNFNANKPRSQHGEFHKGSARPYLKTLTTTPYESRSPQKTVKHTYVNITLPELPERTFNSPKPRSYPTLQEQPLATTIGESFSLLLTIDDTSAIRTLEYLDYSYRIGALD